MASYDKPDYDKKQFNSMKDEAVWRIKEMHKRAKSDINVQKNVEPEKSETIKNENLHNNKQNQRVNNNFKHQQNSSPFSQFFNTNSNGFEKLKNAFSPKKQASTNEDNSDKKDPLQNVLGGIFDGAFKDFNIDTEKIILGVLIYLIYKNKGDTKLLLALGYLLL